VVTDNLSAYYSTSTFGTAATLTHAAVSSSIVVIFDSVGTLVTVGDVEVQIAGPVARCKTSDVSAAVRGDTLVVNAVTYYVTRNEPLNNEESLLHLSKDN